jgi:hypothetical protein
MALTKPRAYQIFDLDYKQSVRVLTTPTLLYRAVHPMW